MKIKKDIVKSIRETANVVNSYSKTYRNPMKSFIYPIGNMNDGYLYGDFEKCGDKKYICTAGQMTYLVTIL